MFYSQCLVSRNGPLGAIWVAAYFFKKLKKAQVKATHIPSSVDQILQKELDALTYRVLAYLLLGVVRIYSKKVDFLFDDCNKALIGVKEFVAKEKNREKTAVPLPASTGCFSIVLPESFELDAFEFDLGILEDFHGGNVKPQEDITLKDGSQETESMDMYSMERFDMDDDLMFTFHETFSANQNETKHESFARDMDVDAENVKDTTEEASVRVTEAEPLDDSRDHENASRQREDPESDEILVEPQMSEDIRRAQEEHTVREAICTIVRGLVDPHEPSGDNLHRDGHAESSESEKPSVETSCAKTQQSGSLLSECESLEAIHGTEEQPSGATRIDGEKEIPAISTIEEREPEREPEPEPVSLTGSRDLPEGMEKCRGSSEAEMMKFELSHGSRKEQSETPEENLNGSEKDFLSDMTVSKDPSRGFNATDIPVAVTPITPLPLKKSGGETSPQFSIIPTPAAKESSRVSRKRKCLIDDEVIIPNKVMKEMIEDSSKLLSKRRNVSHTDCPERRTKRFAARSFLDPLIQYGSVELQSLFCQPIKLKNWATDDKITRRREKSSRLTVRITGDVLSSDQTQNAQEIMETPQAAALSGLKVTVGNINEVPVEMEASSTASGNAHQPENAAETTVKHSVIAPETPVRTSEHTGIAPETPVVFEQVEIAPETPVRESMSTRYFKDPETRYKETRPASPFTSLNEHPSVYCVENRDLDTILMNDEVNADERQDLQQETWSARTRNVAKFLEKTFTEQREREEEEKVSLLQLCRGRIQKESARLFYETLVLKTKGYLEVKQDSPYSDVLLTPFTRQQKAC
ncbi:PREDICTED: sister chromatid cohesion 1 protein 2-like isoform X2 [Camelina sativa]|uniref:Sister chromatid cohesion 1 protein 2-like isoform X2 n=1 Tax=Camelina sativa TaxID=90675 RepID=A0ABM0V4F9_CAMSA|nr:PREDICTED: sister chromatid cohesion 1 protein 2-like isoform X2 [Camelina sativa]